MLGEQAAKALRAASGSRPLVEAAGPGVSLGEPAATRLLGGGPASPEIFNANLRTMSRLLAERDTGPVRFNDTFGFSRPAYYPLILHLYLAATGEEGDRDVLGVIGRSLHAGIRGWENRLRGEHLPLTLWWALCLDECARLLGESDGTDVARRIADTAAAREGDGGANAADDEGKALHPREELSEPLDAWTFRELVGLHALARLAILNRNPVWWRRVREITQHHQAHTQPDYTTYQPWGVFAFLCDPQTILFGEQQLHDAVTHLHVEGGGAGLVPGLLMADAAVAITTAQALSFITDPEK